MEFWEGKVALVTGSASGIGAATTTALVAAGMIVVGVDKDKSKLQEVAEKLANRKGKFHYLQVDLRNEVEILKAFEWIDKNLGPVHCLVNNAGILPGSKLVSESDTNVLRAILEINVLAVEICAREALKLMARHNVDDGIIFNFGSVSAQLSSPRPGFAAYSAAKRSIPGITEGIRIELALAKSNIKTTTIVPGIVNTNLFINGGGVIPSGRPSLEPEHVAQTIIAILQMPPNVQVTEICVRAVGEDLTRP